MVRLIHGWVRVKAGVRHDAIDEIVNDYRDAVNSAQTIVKGSFFGSAAMIISFLFWLFVF